MNSGQNWFSQVADMPFESEPLWKWFVVFLLFFGAGMVLTWVVEKFR
ncbi:MAG: hypothetical protein IRZ03_18380 [Acidobacterium ailaaui]|nr:hypothetical protein [Pseudacidobacterium ailaaui]